MPEKAIQALQTDPDGLILKIMDLRGYERAYTAYKQGEHEKDQERKPKGPAIDRVESMVMELAKEQMEKVRNR